jgi:hypothetical protein
VSDEKRRLGERLRKARKERGLSLVEVYAGTDISVSFLSGPRSTRLTSWTIRTSSRGERRRGQVAAVPDFGLSQLMLEGVVRRWCASD